MDSMPGFHSFHPSLESYLFTSTRRLSRMRSHVCLQITDLRKLSSTVLTTVRLNFQVYVLVFIERATQSKRLAALLAGLRLHVGMKLHVFV